jgi:hypothetical protein
MSSIKTNADRFLDNRPGQEFQMGDETSPLHACNRSTTGFSRSIACYAVGVAILATAIQPASLNAQDEPSEDSPAQDADESKIIWSTQGRNDWLVGVRVIGTDGLFKVGQVVTLQYCLRNTTKERREIVLNKYYDPGRWYTSLSASNDIRIDFFSDTSKSETFELGPGQVLEDEQFRLTVNTTGFSPGVYRIGVSSAFWTPSKTEKNRHEGLPMRGRAEVQVGDPKVARKPLRTGPTTKNPKNRIYWGNPIAGISLGARFREGRNELRDRDVAEADLFLFNTTDKPIEATCLLPHPYDGWLLNVETAEGGHVMLDRVFTSLISMQSYLHVLLEPGQVAQLTNAPQYVGGSEWDIEHSERSTQEGAKFDVLKTDKKLTYSKRGRLNQGPGKFLARYSVTMQRNDMPGVRLSASAAAVPFEVKKSETSKKDEGASYP